MRIWDLITGKVLNNLFMINTESNKMYTKNALSFGKILFIKN